MSNYPLLGNGKYYTSRRGKILGIVLHVTAGAQDLGMVGTDNSAANTIRYGQTTTRAASWHAISDTDSAIYCLPDTYTAFHVRNYNAHTLGLEICNADARWDNKPEAWIDATLRNSADICRNWARKYGLPLTLVDKRGVDSAIANGRKFGFTYHSYLDPSRRVDPGRTFPWHRFIALVNNGTVLARGSKGPSVTILQRRLIELGNDLGKWGADGDFGDATERSVRAFQQAAGLTVDGKVGEDTQRALDAYQPNLGLPVTERHHGDTLLPGDTLTAGAYLTPDSKTGPGLTMLIHQGDGNVVLYDGKTGATPWHTHYRGDKFTFQTDGNLVLYRGNEPKWASHTAGRGGERVILQADGNFVMYGPNGTVIWASHTVLA